MQGEDEAWETVPTKARARKHQAADAPPGAAEKGPSPTACLPRADSLDSSDGGNGGGGNGAALPQAFEAGAGGPPAAGAARPGQLPGGRGRGAGRGRGGRAGGYVRGRGGGAFPPPVRMGSIREGALEGRSPPRSAGGASPAHHRLPGGPDGGPSQRQRREGRRSRPRAGPPQQRMPMDTGTPPDGSAGAGAHYPQQQPHEQPQQQRPRVLVVERGNVPAGPGSGEQQARAPFDARHGEPGRERAAAYPGGRGRGRGGGHPGRGQRPFPARAQGDPGEGPLMEGRPKSAARPRTHRGHHGRGGAMISSAAVPLAREEGPPVPAKGDHA